MVYYVHLVLMMYCYWW